MTALLAGFPFLAVADHQEPRDPEDVRGPLDVRVVRTWGSDKLGWRIVTYSGWRVKRIFDKGFLMMHLDTFGGQRADYYALLYATGPDSYRMRAELWRDRSKRRDFKVSDLRTWRKNRRSVSVVVPRDALFIGDKRTHYRWNVQTLWSGKGCAQVCFDLVPNGGEFVTEPLQPEVAPSPSPTVSVSPSPSVSPTP